MSNSTETTTSNRFILSIFTTGLLAAALVTPIAYASAHEPAKTDSKTMPAPPMSGMKDMSDMKGMSMTGDVDYDFAANMRMHHQMAVEMSQAQLKNGKSPRLRAMATSIIAAQKKEIATLDAWMVAHKKGNMKAKP